MQKILEFLLSLQNKNKHVCRSDSYKINIILIEI